MSFKTRLQSLLGLETKSGVSNPDPWLFEQFSGGTSAAGIVVTPRTAMECAPVRCGVQAIGETIGQLPLQVFSRGASGSKERARNHPAYRLLHDAANEWTPATKFREEITRDALLRPYGGFAFINRVDGKPVELIRLDPEVSPVTVDSSNGEPVYTVQEGNDKREIARENILHIPTPSMSCRGLAYDARNAIGLALVLERYANKLFANGVRPGSLLLAKDAKTPDAIKNIKALFNAQFSGDGTGSNAVLPGDLTYQQLTLSSVDAQFLEMRATPGRAANLNRLASSTRANMFSARTRSIGSALPIWNACIGDMQTAESSAAGRPCPWSAARPSLRRPSP